jgi:hypothetical protein
MAAPIKKQLNIILDIDNTLFEYSGRKGLKEQWAALPEAERKKYELREGFIVRPQLWDFLAWLKKLAKTVNLWTASEPDYANWVKDVIEGEMGEGFISNVWSSDDCAAAKAMIEKKTGKPSGVVKNLNYIWYVKKKFNPCDTILIDDVSGNIHNNYNYQNGIQLKAFALWGNVSHDNHEWKYRNMSDDRTLLDVVDVLKKVNQKDLCPDGEEEDSHPFEEAPTVGGRRKTRKFKRYAKRRYGTARRYGGGRS